MISIKEHLLLYAVTDRSWTNSQTLEEQVEEAIEGGITLLQLREKDVSPTFFHQEATSILQLCKKHQVPLIINDDVDIALNINADGVHVGQDDLNAKEVRQIIGEEMILGVSCQNVEQAIKAENDGADYLGVGAVFTTTTKDDAQNTSLETLKNICQAVSIPVVAIGGIKESNISKLHNSGIAGVAIVSDIFGATNIKQKVNTLLAVTKEMLTNEG
ncbi:MAG: thiamine phosphate synthase [Coprobacillaceae bacterium]